MPLSDALKAPLLRADSTLQFTLNLFDLGSIAASDGHFTDEDEVEHVDEPVGWDLHQFSEHGHSLRRF